jgi:hypothetical protein
VKLAKVAVNSRQRGGGGRPGGSGRFYNKPLRTQAMIEIRRRVVEGQNHDQIMRDLHLSERTFFRYLNLVFEKDRQRMNQIDEEVMNHIVILTERFTKMYRELEEIANDSAVDGMARVKALQLAAELALSIVKIHREVPARLVANKELPYSMSELLPQQQDFDNNNDDDDSPPFSPAEPATTTPPG